MLIGFFNLLRQAGLPVSIPELLTLLEALQAGLAFADREEFYHLSRTALIKDERYYDRFDRVFAAYFSELDSLEDLLEAIIPEDWLRSEFMRQLSDEERQAIETLGGLEQLIEEFRRRLEEQRERHEGGNRWIGTGGTSPFGHSGYHPEGIRVGGESRHRRGVKVWEQRRFADLDDQVELGTRNLKLALRRLRQFARTGAAEELDLEETIRATARNAGLLDLKMIPERHNAVRVLLFFDVGGSMDDHVRICEELFSAARSEFKHMEYYYFHNYLYESVWRNNQRRYEQRIPTFDLLHRYSADYKVIFVGDAAMSPYEILHPGGSVEHWNEESGATWMQRILEVYPDVAWINPVPREQWAWTQSTELIQRQLGGRMYPLTLAGLEEAMAELAR